MKWIFIGAGLYLGIGVCVLVFKGSGIIDEQKGELYDQKESVRFKVFLTIILIAVVFLWPLVLLRNENHQSRRLYVIKQVMEGFNQVAEERMEIIDGHVMITITSKFVVVYETIGRIMFKEHLKYELEKYRKEGLRSDYLESTT